MFLFVKKHILKKKETHRNEVKREINYKKKKYTQYAQNKKQQQKQHNKNNTKI